MWTRFMDMHSGGSLKEKQQYIYIEAPEDEAKVIFYNRFDHNPDRVTCTCCGNDYSIDEGEDIQQVTAYERGCSYSYFYKSNDQECEGEAKYNHKKSRWEINGKEVYGKYVEKEDKKWGQSNYVSLEDYMKKEDVLFIFNKDIKNEEHEGEIPEQGYVWVD